MIHLEKPNSLNDLEAERKIVLSQHLEIEFKNLLIESEFDQLCNAFGITPNDFFLQENHYFDTETFALKNLHSALRIREKDGSYEMTLKQPSGQELLETNQIISKDEAATAFQSGKLPGGPIEAIIKQYGISFSDLSYFGSLKTERAEINFRQGLLVLDHSYYLNFEDFELEYEVENYEAGLKIFSELLKEHVIPMRITNNKIQRFYERKSSLQEDS
nr:MULTISPECIES: CYTH domain-containing protein [unclassified Bacillus (in: firmicutes)]